MGSEREGQAALSSVWKKAREGKVRFVSTIESIKSRTYRSVLHLISARLVAAILSSRLDVFTVARKPTRLVEGVVKSQSVSHLVNQSNPSAKLPTLHVLSGEEDASVLLFLSHPVEC